ncbi:MAG: nucleotidyltransferase [Streptosporangiales bacterium]|nr:nucleotidyltransferase [Streptosporangiales bacterium]
MAEDSAESLEEQLDEGRLVLQVTPEELQEARVRRGGLAEALEDAFPGSRIYVNGSVAHGDANTPLTDVDLGVVVKEADGYGPNGLGPRPLMEQARDAIKDHLKDGYPKLTVTIEGQKRAVLVRFGDPVTPGQDDFTADVIVAIDNLTRPGLFIPNMKLPEGWDRADPETHTELVLMAIEATDRTFARTIRLLKHWRDHHGKPLCSWNIKALALECIAEEPMPLLEALEKFFTHAAKSITDGLTEDPAKVAGKIKLPKGMTRESVAWRLGLARDKIQEAIEHKQAGRPARAQHALHSVLPEVIPDSSSAAQMAEEAKRITTGVGMSTVAAPVPTRAWAPE